jgi:hypothetical protein
MKIFLVREHIAVGDELIRVAYTDRRKAEDDAASRRHKTQSNNFDVVELEEGVERVV